MGVDICDIVSISATITLGNQELVVPFQTIDGNIQQVRLNQAKLTCPCHMTQNAC